MSINKILDEIREVTPNLPTDQQIPYIQSKLTEITDEQERRIAELTFLSIHEGLNLKRPKILFLIHGIRTNAEWQDKLNRIIKKSLSDDDTAIVLKPKYGFFNIISFILPKFVFRRLAIIKIKKQLRLAIAENPNGEITIIAHSFGTYIVSDILHKNNDINIDKLLLCGSIVKEGFKWAELKNLPKLIVNDCGTKDYLPVIAKSLWLGYGSSGIQGFHCVKANNRYHNFGHSSFFDDDFMVKFWLPFITNNDIVESDWTSERDSAPYWLMLLPYIVPMVIILILLYYIY